MKKLIAGKYVTVEANPKAGRKAASKPPVAQGGAGVLTLEAAVKRLDPADKTHWTQGGLPDLTVLSELTGGRVTRREVEKAFPDLRLDPKTGSLMGKLKAAITSRRGGQ